MKKLELPVNIRLARNDEVPNEANIQKHILEGQDANIVEGYTISYNTTADLPFTFFSEINVDNHNLWNLFQSLVLSLPKQVCLIYGHSDSEPNYSAYQDKHSLLEKIQQYSKELSMDGFLEFGVLYHDEMLLNEVFVKKGKYIQYWGTNMESFVSIMRDYSLHHIENLNFIDEFPVTTESLSLYYPKILRTQDIIDNLQRDLR